MLLSDEEIEACALQNMGDTHSAVRAIEAAILAKLAAKELPEPAELKLLVIGASHSHENVSERSFTEAGFLSAAQEIFKLGQAQAHAHGFVAGAAAQLAEKPSAWKYDQNGDWWVTDNRQEVDGDATGDIIELYTRKEAK